MHAFSKTKFKLVIFLKIEGMNIIINNNMSGIASNSSNNWFIPNLAIRIGTLILYFQVGIM